jgi:pyruvate-ferredoxin/flavodoxin oxidoreductase
LCVNACLAKNKKEPQRKAINMSSKALICGEENKNWKFFLGLSEIDKKKLNFNNARNIQFLQPLFEFSGACAGCGETPYVKLLSQLFGDHLLVANATGCSSIYGGNLPTIPWTVNSEGRGPAWSNSLFEDNAEFGMGMRLALDKQFEYAIELLGRLSSDIGTELVGSIIKADQSSETGITEQRERVDALKEKLKDIDKSDARELLSIADVLVKKSVWIVGGDGWAYDIDFGGLDHVLASGSNVKVLVLDTEVYSNTGGQMSKSTPRGAIAKFAAKGKPMPKKDLAMMAMTYGTIYVAVVAIGANDTQAIKAFIEAEAYQGPSLIIAYSHCIAHGYELSHGMDQQKKAVLSGYWPLMRYNPDLRKQGKNPLQLDSGRPSIPLEDYINNETRYRMLGRSDSTAAKELLELARQDILERWHFYEYLSTMPIEDKGDKSEEIK